MFLLTSVHRHDAFVECHADLVEPYGYPLEEVTVQTADGYLLGVFRIPYGVNEWAPDALAATRRRGFAAAAMR